MFHPITDVGEDPLQEDLSEEDPPEVIYFYFVYMGPSESIRRSYGVHAHLCVLFISNP